jgi:hypothetical protein
VKLLAAGSAVAAQTFATAHRGSITEESRKAGFRRAFNTGSIPAFPGASGCSLGAGLSAIRRTRSVRHATPRKPGNLGCRVSAGTGYEIREYVFEKFGRHCAYCGIADVPLNLDHIHPRSRDGSDRASNLVAACIPCNTDKGARPIEEIPCRRAGPAGLYQSAGRRSTPPPPTPHNGRRKARPVFSAFAMRLRPPLGFAGDRAKPGPRVNLHPVRSSYCDN